MVPPDCDICIIVYDVSYKQTEFYFDVHYISI